MAVTLLCPHCKAPLVLSKEIPERCSGCEEEFPPEIVEAANRARARQRPALLTVGMWLSFFAGFFWLGTYLMALLDVNEAISYSGGRSRFLRDGATVAALGFLLLLIAIGLWKERRWVRPLAMVYWLATLTVSIGIGTNRAESTLILLPALVLAGWYFYNKRNVVAYYEELRREATAS